MCYFFSILFCFIFKLIPLCWKKAQLKQQNVNVTEWTKQTTWDFWEGACHSESALLLILPTILDCIAHMFQKIYHLESFTCNLSYSIFFFFCRSSNIFVRCFSFFFFVYEMSKQFLPVKHLTDIEYVNTQTKRFSLIKRKCIAKFFDFSLNVSHTHILCYVVVVVVYVLFCFEKMFFLFSSFTDVAIVRSTLSVLDYRIYQKAENGTFHFVSRVFFFFFKIYPSLFCQYVCECQVKNVTEPMKVSDMEKSLSLFANGALFIHTTMTLSKTNTLLNNTSTEKCDSSLKWVNVVSLVKKTFSFYYVERPYFWHNLVLTFSHLMLSPILSQYLHDVHCHIFFRRFAFFSQNKKVLF